jgi:hypothetical protein
MNDSIDYERDMRIDDSALDLEWEDQATLAMKYVKYYSKCRKRLTLAEEKIKVVRAELIKLANQNPDKFLGNGVKPTAPNVEAFYRMHPRHKAAKDEWIEAQFELNMAEGAKSEISFTRKSALENLVILHGQGYFAGPTMPRDLKAQRIEFDKRMNRGIASKMNMTVTRTRTT